ncbi:MAG: fibronectin type III domain-containing protein [Candidatus Nanopelagicales bacterium]
MPAAPTNVKALAGSNRATVTWTAPPGADTDGVLQYRVQKSTDGGTRWTSVVGSPVAAPRTKLVVLKLSNNRTYRFRVAAESEAGVGPWSAPSSTVRPSSRPPGKLAAFSGTSPRAGTIKLTWKPPSSGPRPTRYDYRYRKGFGTFTRWIRLPVTARSVVITGLVRRADYLCQVRAVNGADVGPTNTTWVRTR